MDDKIPENFNDALKELEELTAEFENGEVDLEKGIPKFKRGMELARSLKKKLGEMENEVKEIKEKFKDLDENIVENRGDETQSLDDTRPEKSDDLHTSDIPF